MKQKTKRFICVGLASVLIFLCGCQQSPLQNVVTSKNDGSFNASLVQTATEDKGTNKIQTAEYSEVFTSTDRTVEFRLQISEELLDRNMPVVEVVPHYLSEKDVQRVALALFGDIDFYETEPRLAAVYSKDEILEKINRWSEYANTSALSNLYGDTINIQFQETLVKQFIETYTELYETATDESVYEQCQWQFKKDSYYWVSAEEIAGQNLENENDVIEASVKIGNINYNFSASKRNKDDFKLNNISAYLYAGTSPNSIDERIFRAWLCRTEEPTEKQIASVKAKAESILQQIQLGDWFVDECYVEKTYYGDTPEYVICVNAVPVLNNIPAIRRPQLTNLKSEDIYASNYYLTDVNFEFSANGELVSFWMYSPIDIKNTVNDNAEVLSIEGLVELAKNYLALSDYYEYGFGPMIDSTNEELSCVVNITRLDYNLTRVKVPNSDESYYYVPGIALSGNVEYYGKESGDIYFKNDNVTLVTLNGVDGSIVNTTNE